jgi:hypothetical protein
MEQDILTLPEHLASLSDFVMSFWPVSHSRTEKVIKSKIEPGLPFMVPDILYKIQMIYLRQMQEVHTDMGQIIQKNNTPRCLAVEV